MGQQQPLEVLEAIEQALAEHAVFANSSYILAELRRSLETRLQAISDRIPEAGRLLNALARTGPGQVDHLIGDTVVRCAIIHAFTQLETDVPSGLPLPDCAAVFEATIERLSQGRFTTCLDDGSLSRLGPEPFNGWLWNDAHPDDVFGRAFRFLMKDRYGAIPRTATKGEAALLIQGALLMRTLLPRLGPSALVHAHTICCVPDSGGWKSIASGSQFHLGGTIFIGGSMHGPWWAAEHLLHESVHHKMYDFRQAHSVELLEPTEIRDAFPRILVPWNPKKLNNSNVWDINRAFAAFHVYIHLALLALVAEQRAPAFEDRYGPFHSMIESRTALDRAQFFAEKLKEQCWDHIGPAGKRLAEWLFSTLEFLDPSPPPRGAYIHLYLDQYRKEGRRVAADLALPQSPRADISQQLISLAKDEVAGARAILSAVDARPALARFDDAIGQLPEAQLDQSFSEVRRLIETAFLDASPDGYRLTLSGEHDRMVRELIETSSQRAFVVMAGYPPAVAEAKRRAHAFRFTQSCDDEVGRLLSVLAGATPRGGRIFEIGAGTGVGAAWITAGLGERTDVELVSFEIDPKLSDAAREGAWPSYVQFVTGDATETLKAYGLADLVFTDAAPVKYGHIDLVLGALRPGGFMVIDDLNVGPRTTEAQRGEKDALRSILLNRLDIRLVEFDWSTGVILASKSR